MHPDANVTVANSRSRLRGEAYRTRHQRRRVHNRNATETLEVSGLKDAVGQTVRVCSERGIGRVVVGLPLNMDSTCGRSAEAAMKYIEALRAALDFPVETEDERLTTQLVERMLIEGDVSRAKRKKVRDKLAAQAILQGYLDRVRCKDMESDY